MIYIESGTFAEACYDMNTVDELRQALIDGPDPVDMAEWGITESQWRQSVETALAAKLEDDQ